MHKTSPLFYDGICTRLGEDELNRAAVVALKETGFPSYTNNVWYHAFTVRCHISGNLGVYLFMILILNICLSIIFILTEKQSFIHFSLICCSGKMIFLALLLLCFRLSTAKSCLEFILVKPILTLFGKSNELWFPKPLLFTVPGNEYTIKDRYPEGFSFMTVG